MDTPVGLLWFANNLLFFGFEIIALLFPSSVEFGQQYKSEGRESSYDIQGAPAPPALGQIWRPGV